MNPAVDMHIHRFTRIAGLVTVAVAFAGVGWWLAAPATPSRSGNHGEAARVASTGPRSTDGRQRPAAPRPPSAPATPPAPIQLTPGAPGYDGVRVAEWLGLSPGEAFDREPVDPVWAPLMERELSGIVADGVETGVLMPDSVVATCHTASCQISIETSAADERAIHQYFQVISPIGSTIAFTGETLEDGRVRVLFSTVYDNQLRDPSAFGSRLRQWREDEKDGIAAWHKHRRGER